MKRTMTKEGFFKKYEYAYDKYYDCYVCTDGMKVGLTFACMNLKKLAKMMVRKGHRGGISTQKLRFNLQLFKTQRKVALGHAS